MVKCRFQHKELTELFGELEKPFGPQVFFFLQTSSERLSQADILVPSASLAFLKFCALCRPKFTSRVVKFQKGVAARDQKQFASACEIALGT